MTPTESVPKMLPALTAHAVFAASRGNAAPFGRRFCWCLTASLPKTEMEVLMTKTFAYLSIVLTAVAMTTPSIAADEHNVVPGLTAAGAPLGLHGVDPVAFLELGNRLDGKAKYTAIYDTVAYYFSSAENMDAFNKNPARFVPQNGGFCTYGVSVGKKFDGNPALLGCG